MSAENIATQREQWLEMRTNVVINTAEARLRECRETARMAHNATMMVPRMLRVLKEATEMLETIEKGTEK